MSNGTQPAIEDKFLDQLLINDCPIELVPLRTRQIDSSLLYQNLAPVLSLIVTK
jgi:hypothetical protein